MNTRALSKWFLTDAGKKFCFYAAGTATAGALLCNFLPHTLLLNQYKDIVQLYKNGFTVPLTQKLHERFQKALDLVQVDPVDKHLYKPFFCYGFDVMSAGSSYSRFGVLVGLPINFSYEDTNMVDRSKIKVNQESIVWESEDGERLLKSLVMSENAQLYAMAKEIKYRQTAKPMLDTFFSTSSCLLAYSLSNHINTKFNFYAKPFGVRFVIYSLVGLFAYGFYAMSKDMTQLFYEERIDKDLKQTNQLFSEGGKEYYSKILDRNLALRKLLGREGERMYSILGNENYLFRNRHLPLVQRKSFFEEHSAS